MRDTSPLALTLDFGTQSVKAALFDLDGNVVAFEKEDYPEPYFSRLPNYAEQWPDYYYDCMSLATKRLAERNPELMKRVKAGTVDCFRDSCVLLDKDRKAIRPMIVWLDQRMADCKKKLPLISRLAFWIVGMSETARLNRERSYANWIQENEPDLWGKCDKYVNASCYFVYRLTGNLVDSPSSVAGHYPINFRKRRWYRNPTRDLKGQLFGVRKDQLPELVPVGEVMGKISKKCAEETGLPEGLPIISSGSDKSCETLGLGVIDSSMAALSFGTAATVETTTTRYIESERFLPGFPSCIPGAYNLDVQIYRGYWMISWFREQFAMGSAPKDLDKMLEQVPPGSDGLILQPYWGPGLARPLTKGTVIGWSDATGKAHMYRAIVEGIDYALRESFESFERKVHHRIPVIRVSGGGAHSEAICQITADIFNRPVERVQTTETSSLGAAMAVFLATGDFSSPKEAAERMVHKKDRFEPRPEIARKYDFLFKNVYLKLYPSLKKQYKAIKAFNRAEEKEKLAHGE